MLTSGLADALAAVLGDPSRAVELLGPAMDRSALLVPALAPADAAADTGDLQLLVGHDRCGPLVSAFSDEEAMRRASSASLSHASVAANTLLSTCVERGWRLVINASGPAGRVLTLPDIEALAKHAQR